uniref:Uncharacterized protein n=1 Tax=Solanum tuberosum TaxID=4113 RepID=M0ZK03_SOLTU
MISSVKVPEIKLLSNTYFSFKSSMLLQSFASFSTTTTFLAVCPVEQLLLLDSFSVI